MNGRPAIEDGRIRQQIARNHAMRAGLDSINVRARLMMEAGMPPGPEGSLNKLVAVRSRPKLSELALDLQGAAGFAFDPHPSPKDDCASSSINPPHGPTAGAPAQTRPQTIPQPT